MKRSKKVLISTAAVLILSTASISMVAARGYHSGFGGCNGGYGNWQQGPGQTMQKQGSWMEQRMQDRLGYMKYTLGITKEQEPAWKEFTEAVGSKAATMRNRMQQRGAQQTVAERVKRMRDGSEQMTQMANAIEKMYNALTPEQQKIADQISPRRMRGF
jgi:Spy/CpxP family protein refolding chaperone